MKRGFWLALLAPVLITLALAYGVGLTSLGTKLLRIGIEFDTLILILGLGASLLLLLQWAVWRRANQMTRQAVTRARTEAFEERRRFLGRLDHELKNPLTAIRAGLANLAPSGDDGEGAEARSSVESQILRLSRLTSDLRKLADLESRPLQERNPVELGALLTEAFEAASEQPASGERSMTLTLPQAPWPLPQVHGDRDLLFLAVFNLLDNALKFTRPGDTVELRAFEDGARVVVEVADTGMGIPGDEARHVWEELYRGQEAQGIPGSGLGLSLVRAIIERHGGQAELRSKPDHGTVVTLRLPIAG